VATRKGPLCKSIDRCLLIDRTDNRTVSDKRLVATSHGVVDGSVCFRTGSDGVVLHFGVPLKMASKWRHMQALYSPAQKDGQQFRDSLCFDAYDGGCANPADLMCRLQHMFEIRSL
jgi:hypothetical protein